MSKNETNDVNADDLIVTEIIDIDSINPYEEIEGKNNNFEREYSATPNTLTLTISTTIDGDMDDAESLAAELKDFITGKDDCAINEDFSLTEHNITDNSDGSVTANINFSSNEVYLNSEIDSLESDIESSLSEELDIYDSYDNISFEVEISTEPKTSNHPKP